MRNLKNILQYLEQIAIKNENKIAVIEENKKIDYSDLIDKSKRVGSLLCNFVEHRNPVGVFMDKGINAIYSFFGIVYSGGFYVLLNPELPETRLQKILEISKINIIITDEINFEKDNNLSENLTVLKIEDIQDSNIDE